MAGLPKICKMYGSINVRGKEGGTVVLLYDYYYDKPRLKQEMTKEEIRQSERAKWERCKK